MQGKRYPEGGWSCYEIRLHFLGMAAKFLWDLESLLIQETTAFVPSLAIWIGRGVASQRGSALVSPSPGSSVEQLRSVAIPQQWSLQSNPAGAEPVPLPYPPGRAALD